MKIGILTFHYAHNYGAVLQAFALLSKLKELGHDAYIIDRRPDYTGIIRWIYHHVSYKHVWGWLKFDIHVNRLLQPKTKRYDSQVLFKRDFSSNHLDAVIVGSDQVWRWNWRMVGLNYFLDFTTGKQVRKIAYAASFGCPEWNDNPENTKKVKELLNDFYAISVRETEGCAILKKVFGLDSHLVLDPTLLYDRRFYEQTLSLPPRRDNNKVVSVMLSQPELSLKIRTWAKDKNLRHTELYSTFYECKQLIGGNTDFHWQHVTPSRWLEEIQSARYVITNSFHATVFCILFGKQFAALKYAKGGSGRIETLLQNLSLENRLLFDVDDIEAIIDSPIDYTSVYENLGKLREESINYLLHMLK